MEYFSVVFNKCQSKNVCQEAIKYVTDYRSITNEGDIHTSRERNGSVN